MTKTHMTKMLAVLAGSAALAVSGCKSKDVAPGVASAQPGASFRAPLGTADGIEPPSRDFIPGMTVAEAKAKGAKPGNVNYRLKTPRKDIELRIDKDSGVVEDLEVEYTKQSFAALKAKLGKPLFDDVYVGANWLVQLSDSKCDDGCTVDFYRSPMNVLAKTLVPPGPLNQLTATSTKADVAKLVGNDCDGKHIPSGYGFKIRVDYDGDHISTVVFTSDVGDSDQWDKIVAKMYGPTTKLDDKDVWVNAKDGWLVELGSFGYTLTYRPITASTAYLAKTGTGSMLAQATSVFGKPKASLAKVAGFDAKDDHFLSVGTELALDTNTTAVSYDDKDVVDSVDMEIHTGSADAAEKVIKGLASNWGAITKIKDGDDSEETQAIKLDGGLIALIDTRDSVVTIKLKRPAASGS